MYQERVTKRLRGLDALKGLLTLKMAAAHVAPCFGIAVLWPFHIFSAFTFSTLLFCFGVGIGLSSRRRRLAQALPLISLYVASAAISAFADASQHAALIPAMRTAGATFLSTLPKTLLLDGPGASYVVPFIAFALVAVWAHRPSEPLNLFRYVFLFLISVIVALMGNLFATLWPNGVFAGLYGFGFRTLQSAPIMMTGYLMGRYLQSGGTLPSLSRREAWQFAGVAIGLLMANQFTNAWFKGTSTQWKESGRIGYALVGGLVAGLLFFAAEMYAKHCEGKVLDVFARVGRKTLTSLGLQTATMPVAALIAMRTDSQAAKIAIGLGYVAVLGLWLAKPVRVRSIAKPILVLTWQRTRDMVLVPHQKPA